MFIVNRTRQTLKIYSNYDSSFRPLLPTETSINVVTGHVEVADQKLVAWTPYGIERWKVRPFVIERKKNHFIIYEF